MELLVRAGMTQSRIKSVTEVFLLFMVIEISSMKKGNTK